MFSKNKKSDFIRFCKAFLTNQYAHFAPDSYINFTQETGRGLQEESESEVVGYFSLCFSEYMKILEIPEDAIHEKLKGCTILEYGPGDIPGVALLFYAWGAEKIFCVDRFALVSFSEFNITTLLALCNTLPKPQCERALSCFNDYGNPGSGLKENNIQYLINKNGVSGLNETIDIVCSRAVLEHVNNLQLTFEDMEQSLKKSGIAIHKVDLKSHGLHRENILDFLTWPNLLWNLMYSYKGTPNRIRLSQYKEVIAKTKLKLDFIKTVENCTLDIVKEVRPWLAKSFSHLSDEDLSCLSFWFKVTKV